MDRYIVGIGEALWDMLPEGRKIGGAPANFAYHASQFGYKSKAVSAVGNDDLGRELLSDFDKVGLKYTIEKVDFETGTVLVELNSNGVPQYTIKEGVAWDNIPFTDKLKKLAEQTNVICFGSLAQRSSVSRETINKFIDSMPKDERCYRIFDINLRQSFYTKEIITDSIYRSNILKINDEELEIVSNMFGCSDICLHDKCMAILNRFNLEILVLTCGAIGSYVFTLDKVSYQATPKVVVADTVGAGDSFTATFITSLLSGESIEKAHQKAVTVSAYVCTQHGAMPHINL